MSTFSAYIFIFEYFSIDLMFWVKPSQFRKHYQSKQ